MKKQLIILFAFTIAIPVLAQQSDNPEVREQMEQQRRQHEQRKYQFMDRMLTKIGVSDEDKIQISTLQSEHRRKIEVSKKRMEAAQAKLAWIQETDATDAEIDAAIQEIGDAQTEQLTILVYNRREMEKILGKEKYAQLMEIARTQFHKRGHGGSHGLPPRPGLPPIPGKQTQVKEPPMPPNQKTVPTPPES